MYLQGSPMTAKLETRKTSFSLRINHNALHCLLDCNDYPNDAECGQNSTSGYIVPQSSTCAGGSFYYPDEFRSES